MLVLAALLYALGMHAARACHPVSTEQIGGVAVVQGTACHQDEPDAAQAACEAHCRNDAQSGRLSLSFDLPAAMPTAAAIRGANTRARIRPPARGAPCRSAGRASGRRR